MATGFLSNAKKSGGANCGTGAGGFKPGNKCGSGGGKSVGVGSVLESAGGSIELSKELGEVTVPGVKDYRKTPGDFTAATQAAVHYGKKNNADYMVVIGGNSYMNKVFHIATPDQDLRGMGTQLGRGDAQQAVAVVQTASGKVYQGIYTRKAKKPTSNSVRRKLRAQALVSNFAGPTRRELLHGRPHIVAPLALINPGVLNGSRGPLLYPEEELNRNVDAWNHTPIVVYHPTTESGSAISARDPAVLDKQGIGVVLKATYNGKLRAEGWFDIERTRKVDPRVLAALEGGQPIELSTGLFTDNTPASGEYAGKPYSYIARNYRPDHLAILPDKPGACSIQDGCGVLVNEQTDNAKAKGGANCGTGAGGFKPGNKCAGSSHGPHIGTLGSKELADEFLASNPKATYQAKSNAIGKVVGYEVHAPDMETRAAFLKSLYEFKKSKSTNNQETANEQAQRSRSEQTAAKVASALADFNALLNVLNEGKPSAKLDMTPEKACKILADGTANGQPLTKKQKRLFGAICGKREKPTMQTNAKKSGGANCGTGAGGFKPGNKCGKGGGGGKTADFAKSLGFEVAGTETFGGVEFSELKVAKTAFMDALKGAGFTEDTSLHSSGGSLWRKGKTSVQLTGSQNPFTRKHSTKFTITENQETPMALRPAQRAKIIDNLIANCSCEGKPLKTPAPWAEEDREGLETLSDEKLEALDENRKTLAKNQLTANAAPEAMTDEEWMRRAPAPIKRIVANAAAYDAREKARLIGIITANTRNKFSKEQLEAMPLEQLEPIAELAAPSQVQQPALPAYYGGAAGGVANAAPPTLNDDADMDTPRMVFEASSSRK